MPCFFHKIFLPISLSSHFMYFLLKCSRKMYLKTKDVSKLILFNSFRLLQGCENSKSKEQSSPTISLPIALGRKNWDCVPRRNSIFFTFGKEPGSVLDDGFNNGNHVHWRCCCHFCKRAGERRCSQQSRKLMNSAPWAQKGMSGRGSTDCQLFTGHNWRV